MTNNRAKKHKKAKKNSLRNNRNRIAAQIETLQITHTHTTHFIYDFYRDHIQNLGKFDYANILFLLLRRKLLVRKQQCDAVIQQIHFHIDYHHFNVMIISFICDYEDFYWKMEIS